MQPTLRPGGLVIAWKCPTHISPGDIVILLHDGVEKVKRVQSVQGTRIYVVGDNPAHSTDSRDFGWLERSAVVGRVWWPRR